MALGQPADGTIVTIDPDASRTAVAREHWRRAGIADDRIRVVNAPALDAFRGGDPALAGPFDLAFIDALKQEYPAYVEEIVPRLEPGALVVADNVLWSGRVSGGRPRRDATDGPARVRAGAGDPRFTGRSCRSATDCSSPPGATPHAR
jgi:caffeoyl-CoA O-methyltransferase